MNDRIWAPNGVSFASENALTADIIDSIETLIEAKGFSSLAKAAFLAELYNAEFTYFGALELKEKSNPSSVRDNLQKILKTCTKLSEQLDNLDQNSISLIEEEFGDYFHDFRKLELELGNVIRSARANAQSYPLHGRLIDYPIHLMALRVRYAIEKHLGVKATATKASRDGALFDEILSTMVPALRRKVHELSGKPFDEDQTPDVHKLTLRAVKGEILVSGDIPPRFKVHLYAKERPHKPLRPTRAPNHAP